MKDVILDALFDSLKVFGILLVFYFIWSFIEDKMSKKLFNNHKFSPVIGALSGSIPQCGISVLASDLYIKRHIAMGTLLAVFIATSDEALPILLSQPSAIKAVGPLLVVKIITAIAIGYLVNAFHHKEIEHIHEHLDHCDHEDETITGCCYHHVHESGTENKIEEHVWHPLYHAFKIFGYVLIINLVFSILIYYIGEDKIMDIFNSNKYLTPLFATLVGLIPNCASSVIITELFIGGVIPFGATVAGLTVNAGMGLFMLYRHNKNVKKNLLITGILVLTGLVVGYALLLIL